jgi:flagellar basal body P-ring protein FlgI
MKNILVAATLLLGIESAHATSRIKDVTSIQGLRDNQLVGYGLVTVYEILRLRINPSAPCWIVWV